MKTLIKKSSPWKIIVIVFEEVLMPLFNKGSKDHERGFPNKGSPLKIFIHKIINYTNEMITSKS
jgi:hypothetical protein